jgi:putative endonuclease
MNYHIYILFSVELNRYYVGSSSDPWKRHLEHISNSIDKYTGRSKDWDLKTVFSLENKTEAIRIERFIKKQKSRTLIERMCQDDFIGTDNLVQLVRVPHVRD